MTKIQKQDWLLLGIFIITALSIIIKSYFDTNGYLNPDSCNYLACAKSLINGHGYFVTAYGLTGNRYEFFSIWPVGYPTLIYFASKLTGLTVFWASKFLNMVLIGFILLIFRTLFKERAYIYGLIFFFASYVEIYAETLSEGLFIFALVLFSSLYYKIIATDKNNFLLFLLLTVSSLLLFFTRYIGVFSFGLIGLLGLYYLFIKRDNWRAFMLISISAVNSISMILYLYHNFIETGFPTGMPRIPSPETNYELSIALFKAIVSEFGIPIKAISNEALMLLGIQFVFIGYLYVKYSSFIRTAIVTHKIPTLSIVFAIVGFTYLFFIILMRWQTQFDIYSHRLLAPGTFLIFVALFQYILEISTHKGAKIFVIFLSVFSFISLLLNFPILTYLKYKKSPIIYEQNIKNINDFYRKVEDESIVIFGSMHLKYLRPELEIRQPFALPYYNKKEEWQDFLKRINPSNCRSIYLFVPMTKEEMNSDRWSQSVIDFVNQHNVNQLVQIR